MRWRRPDGLGQLDPAAGIELARLGGLEAFARSVLVGVIPLTAFEALGSKEAVSYVFFGGAMMTLFFTLNVGWLEERLHRRWVVTLAAALLFLAAFLLIFAQGPVFALAEGLRSSEASLFSVCLSLYIMDFIGKNELTTTESRRMAYSGLAWVAGPSIGVWLWSHGYTIAPFLLSMVATVAMVAYFWRLRIHHNPVLRGPTTAVTRPLHNIAHFFNQRSLRIAYAITTARSVFGLLCSSTDPSTSSRPACPRGPLAVFCPSQVRCCSWAPSFPRSLTELACVASLSAPCASSQPT